MAEFYLSTCIAVLVSFDMTVISLIFKEITSAATLTIATLQSDTLKNRGYKPILDHGVQVCSSSFHKTSGISPY